MLNLINANSNQVVECQYLEDMSKNTISTNLHLNLLHIGQNRFASTYKIVEMSKKKLDHCTDYSTNMQEGLFDQSAVE